VETLKHTLTEECLIVAAVCVIFLLHVRSAFVAILMLPVGVLIAIIVMHFLGLTSNIMSLGGIAIAVAPWSMRHRHDRKRPQAHRTDEAGRLAVQALIDAAVEVGPSLFFGLLIITVSFLPVFTLEDQEGRLFKPLAFTKTFSMAGAAMLSVTLVPVLMMLFVRGKILPEHRNPINRFLIWIYRPVIKGVLKAKMLTILLAIGALGLSIYRSSGSAASSCPI